MKKIILASASPRRKEILKSLGLEFEVFASDIDEASFNHMSPKELVLTLSVEKAKSIQSNLKDCLIIAADTIVVFQDTIYGKPNNPAEAISFLKQLSGNFHEVYTGITIIDLYQNKTYTDYCVTRVEMDQLSDQDILEYVSTEEPLDKAGAYAIQGLGGIFVKGINGDYTNVVGLPVSKLYQGFKVLGYHFFRDL